MTMSANQAIHAAALGVLVSITPTFAKADTTAANEPMPSGVKLMATTEGPAFATSDGKVLYMTSLDHLIPGKPGCDARKITVGVHMGEDYPLPLAESRRSCIEKWPAFAAPATAKPVGRWTVIHREDGISQWAYGGELLYTSMRDTRPGDTNGAVERDWKPAMPDLGLPPQVAVRATLNGLVLVRDLGTADSQLLFEASDESIDPGGWEPLVAPDAVTIRNDDWSTRRRPDGRTQWLYRGASLYYATTATPEERPANLKPAVFREGGGYPKRFSTANTITGAVFADENGKTLYTFSCKEQTLIGVSCDLPSDPAIYRAAMCGSSERCAKQWRPVLAKPEDKPDGAWTIISFPDPPFSDPAGKIGDGVPQSRMWAYKGQPLYTFSDDDAPGDTRGNGVRWFGASIYLALKVPGDDVYVGERIWPLVNGDVKTVSPSKSALSYRE